jgi:hypothetical protein
VVRHEFSYELSEDLLGRGARRYLVQRFGWRIFVGPALLLVVLLPVCESEGGGFVCGAGAGLLLFYVLFLVATNLSISRRAGLLARRLGSREAHCMLTDEGIGLENALSHSFLKWPMIQKVVRSTDVWLLFLNRAQYVTLPGAPLDGEAGHFIETRVSAAGGELR